MPSRALWIVTAIVGLAGAIAFVILMFSDGKPQQQPPTSERGLGFSTGLVLGLALGVAVGFAIARKLQSASPHSERNSP